jgi:uncharacterized membrane protein YecN with MAPEG domain
VSVPVATLFYAGLAGVMLVALSMNVVRLRLQRKVALGDGGVPDLQQAIRVQANFAEYVPLALLLIGLLEMAGEASWVVNMLGIVLILARLAHAVGLMRTGGPSPLRVVGTSGTHGVILVSAILAIVASFGA